MSILLQQVSLAGGEVTDILIDGETISQIAPEITAEAETVIDGTGLYALPGMIDIHVHFRVPGAEYKEDWITGSRAAIAGGVTTVHDMPNNSPAITTRKGLEEKIALIDKDASVNYKCYIGATLDNIEELVASQDIAAGVKVYYGTSTGNLTMNDPAVLKQIMERVKEVPIVIHSEDDSIIEEKEEEYKDYTGIDIHAKVRPREAASSAMATAIQLVRETGATNVHITHMSTKEELDMLREAKEEGLQITCDVTPHHLRFTDKDIDCQGHRLRVNPPIREQADVDALWNGLVDGSVDMIASDHAPHTVEEKDGDDYWSIPSGIPGIEVQLRQALTRAVTSGDMSIERVVEVTAGAPAARFGYTDRGAVQEGMRADIVLVDLKASQEYAESEIQTKAAWSPWVGDKFSAQIQSVIIGGEIR